LSPRTTMGGTVAVTPVLVSSECVGCIKAQRGANLVGPFGAGACTLELCRVIWCGEYRSAVKVSICNNPPPQICGGWMRRGCCLPHSRTPQSQSRMIKQPCSLQKVHHTPPGSPPGPQA
jgi:hypothetical protein